MWHNDYITESDQQAASLWPLIGIVLTVWAVIGLIGYALWSTA